jgi:hypothetical protein
MMSPPTREPSAGCSTASPNGTSLTDQQLNRLAATFDTQGWDATADGLANLAVRAADALDSLHANIERLDAELRDAPTNPIQFARMQAERDAFIRAKDWLTGTSYPT